MTVSPVTEHPDDTEHREPEEPAAELVERPTEAALMIPPPARIVRALRYDGPTDEEGMQRRAHFMAKAKRGIPDELRGEPGDIYMRMLHAQALDIPLARAVVDLHITKSGDLGMRARLMHSLAIRAGHKIEVVHADTRLCRMRLQRGDGQLGGGVVWHISEAQQAGLIKDLSAWKNYPGDLLWARCMSRLTRRYCPDATAGAYDFDEVESIVPDLEPVDLSTAVDLNGDVTAAPDVQDFMAVRVGDDETLDLIRVYVTGEGLDLLNRAIMLGKWEQSREEGLRGAFACKTNGIAVSVEEMLFELGERVVAREEERRAESITLTEPVATPTPAPDPEPAPASDKPVHEQPAGQGTLACGCSAEVVLVAGHMPGCEQRTGY